MEKDPALERRFQQVLVDPPSVPDTVSILRGLKERFEVHHGVRIEDAALVEAATLSDRYITARFLPDKAIDLIDEACAQIRTEIDSVPQELDALNRRVLQLEVEEYAPEEREGRSLQGPARRAPQGARRRPRGADRFPRPLGRRQGGRDQGTVFPG